MKHMVEAILRAESLETPTYGERPCTLDWVARAKRKHKKQA